jgi:hypothetical protein
LCPLATISVTIDGEEKQELVRALNIHPSYYRKVPAKAKSKRIAHGRF